MPGGDRTGPMGRGSMTGARRGYCAESDQPQFARREFGGRGFRRGGGGGGWSWRNRFLDTGVPGRMRGSAVPPAVTGPEPTVEMEMQSLEQRSAALEVEKQHIKARLDELNGTRTD